MLFNIARGVGMDVSEDNLKTPNDFLAHREKISTKPKTLTAQESRQRAQRRYG